MAAIPDTGISPAINPTGDGTSAIERIDHDQLFKLLLTEFFFEFIVLFFPDLAAQIEPGGLEFLDKELFTDLAQGYSHEADIIVKVRMRGTEAFFIIHVENQSTPDLHFGQRMFFYFARLYEKYGLPVYPIVLFSYDAPRKAASTRHTVKIANRLILDFRYEVVQLNWLSWRTFVRNANPVAGALMAKMRIARKDRPRVKLACLTLLGGLPLNDAQKRLLSAFVDTYLSLSPEEEQAYRRERAKLRPEEERNVDVLTQIETILREEKLQQGLQQGLKQGMQQGLQQGLKQGLQQGRQQGQKQGEARFALHVLTQKFGALTPELQKRINGLTIEQLDALASAMLGLSDVGQLQTWLDENS